MRRTAISAAAAITLAAATLTATGAHASYPGANGRLAFGLASTATGQSDVYSILPNGRGLRRLTTYDGQDACATYSPDGHSIAWCTHAGQHARRRRHLGDEAERHGPAPGDRPRRQRDVPGLRARPATRSSSPGDRPASPTPTSGPSASTAPG